MGGTIVQTTCFLTNNIIFQNWPSPSNIQVIALAIKGIFLTFYIWEMLGYQDTLYFMQGNHFFCEVSNRRHNIFYLWNTTQVMLQDCDIQVIIPLLSHQNIRKRRWEQSKCHCNPKL